jgi:hypothetical protein
LALIGLVLAGGGARGLAHRTDPITGQGRCQGRPPELETASPP